MEASKEPRVQDVAEGDVEGQQTTMVDFDEKFPDPYNWPSWQKWAIHGLVTTITFLAGLSTSIVAPSLDVISEELGMEPSFEGPLVMSAYILAMALGPVFLAPFSELYGRFPLCLFGNGLFFVFNLASGFARTKSQLVAFRFLSGAGSGAAPTVSLFKEIPHCSPF